MKSITYWLMMFLALGLISCSNKEETQVPETAPAAESAAQAQETAAPEKSSGAGGYEPTADERVPGITMSQEEIDKQTAEALANTPMPDIPGEASGQK